MLLSRNRRTACTGILLLAILADGVAMSLGVNHLLTELRQRRLSQG
jgi:hypothetical protein